MGNRKMIILVKLDSTQKELSDFFVSKLIITLIRVINVIVVTRKEIVEDLHKNSLKGLITIFWKLSESTLEIFLTGKFFTPG